MLNEYLSYPMNTVTRVIPRAPKRRDTTPVMIRMLPHQISEADILSRQENRSRASFVLTMYERGLKSYKQEKGIPFSE